MTPRTSLSGLWLTALCPGSASLPRVANTGPEARWGSAVHEMVEKTIREGRRLTDSEVDAIADRWGLE